MHSTLVFLTGLSGAGKTTIAKRLARILTEKGVPRTRLDGDELRKGLNSDLDFSAESRSENIRRVAEVSKILLESNTVVIASFIAPFQKDRDLVKATVGEGRYLEVFLDTDLEECEKRDPKGLYAKARRGEIKDMTGVSSPYERPTNPDITIEQGTSVRDAARIIYNNL